MNQSLDRSKYKIKPLDILVVLSLVLYVAFIFIMPIVPIVIGFLYGMFVLYKVVNSQYDRWPSP